MKHVDMMQMRPSQRMSEMWLNLDEVLGHIPVSRAKFWKMIDDGDFPAPHKWKGTPLWPQSAIRTWINEAVNGITQPKSEKVPVTWHAVESLLKGAAPRALTNKQIAHAVGADENDTTNLTRLMAKAGVLLLFKPLRGGSGEPNFYVYNDGICQVPEATR